MRLFHDTVPDQYYAMTARLTAGGHRASTMRVVAGCILTLGLPALLAAPNRNASHLPGGQLLLAVIPLFCVLLASPWLRYRWPTRGQSTAVVIIGALLLSGGCIAAANPFSGMLIATSFPFVVGYAIVFHNTRLQIVVVALAAGTILWLSLVIARSDVPTAIAVTTPVVLINIAVVVACRLIAEFSTGSQRTDIEPLTGLPTRDSFDDQVATMLGARNRGDDRYLVVVLVGIDGFAALHSVDGPRGTDRARVAVAQALRDTVRRDAVLAHMNDSEFLVADTFTTPDPAPLAERIRGAMAATPHGITASIGVVSTPLRPLTNRPPAEVLEEIVALATTAMYRARRGGGNQIEYAAGPTLNWPPDLDPDSRR